MRYCVIKDTTTIIDGSLNSEDVMLANALSAGFAVEQVEILTQEQYDKRKSIVPLDVLKERKIAELNSVCNSTVLGRFKATIDNEEYEFSYDYDAQLRFTGIGVMFATNQISEQIWTAYLNNERVRITLDKINFNNVSIAALRHNDYNVTKFNNLLQQVNAATTKDELEAIVWDE